MALAATKTKTLTIEDLDLDVTYQGELVSKQLNPRHSYKVVQRSEDAFFQHCSMCDRERQARYRATILNVTTGETFHVGRMCLEKHFGVTYDELGKSTVLLAVLARTWQAYKQHVGEETNFATTREAVEDMHHWLSFLANQNIKPFKEAADAVGRISGDLAHINDYRTDVNSLRNLIAIAYENTLKKDVLNDRIVSLVYHPLLNPYERREAEKVLRAENVAWHQVRALSETLGAIHGKNVPVKIRRVPAWNFASQVEYHEALRVYADERLQNLDYSDRTHDAHKFLDVMRQTIQKLRSNGGFHELVFESSTFTNVKHLVLYTPLLRFIEAAGGVYLMAAEPTSYLRYATTSATYHSASAMMRAEQQDEGRDDDRPDRKPSRSAERSGAHGVLGS